MEMEIDGKIMKSFICVKRSNEYDKKNVSILQLGFGGGIGRFFDTWILWQEGIHGTHGRISCI